ncbi:MAG TPA: hypothetical protein VGO90_14620 [Chthoniobacteraceae bacterium]|jgi:hypothetical protein|nr:hypothetical protein [Chthoniobacteraceae bacterium]
MWSFEKIDWEEYYLTVPELVKSLLDGTRKVDRSVERARREYEAKWAEQRDLATDADAFRRQLLFPRPGPTAIFTLGDEVFRGDVLHRHAIKDSLINNTVARYGEGPVCVLGCGFGESTTRLVTSRPKYGGELSDAGVECCRRLGLDAVHFNYYQKDDYRLIRPGTTVLSVHSLEQIPDATSFLEGMRSRKDDIEFVVHLEPTWLEERTGLCGFLRNRYMEVNDYNRNLYAILRDAPDVEILEFQPDVFGQVPLNSSTLIVWRFR